MFIIGQWIGTRTERTDMVVIRSVYARKLTVDGKLNFFYHVTHVIRSWGNNKLWALERVSMDVFDSRRHNARMEEFPYWVREGDSVISNIHIILLLSI